MENNFVKTDVKPVISVDGFYTVHYYNYGKKFKFSGESHDFWEIIYIDRGSASIVAGNKTVELNQGDAFFHKPNQFHSVEAIDFASSIIVTFSMSGKSDFFENKKVKLNSAQRVLLSNVVTEFSQSFSDSLTEIHQKQMHLRSDAPIGATQLMRCYMESFLISLLRKPSAPQKKAETDAELTVKIKKYLTDNLYGSITLDNLSKYLYFSKTYVSAKFKSDTGWSILSYFNKMKIDEAKRLISSGRYSLTQIASIMGYGSSQYFTRIFKKTTGSTPSEWANSTRLDNVLR